jgi:hypothetical protein
VTSDTVDLQPRLSSRAREHAREHRVSLLDVALAPLWALGWLAFWVMLVLTEGGRLVSAAVQLGWSDARAKAQAREVAVSRWPTKPRKARHGPG